MAKVYRQPQSIFCPTDDYCEYADELDDWCDTFKAHLRVLLTDRAVHVERVDDPLAPPLEGLCWVGMGSPNHKGYPSVGIGGKLRKIHRVSLVAHGFRVEGMFGDHLCRNRACFNPQHLEPTVQRVNTLRGRSFSAINVRKTTCKRGHSLMDPANVRVGADGRRHCRACRRMREQEYKAAKRAAKG